jgi:hypothetical protein
MAQGGTDAPVRPAEQARQRQQLKFAMQDQRFRFLTSHHPDPSRVPRNLRQNRQPQF